MFFFFLFESWVPILGRQQGRHILPRRTIKCSYQFEIRLLVTLWVVIPNQQMITHLIELEGTTSAGCNCDATMIDNYNRGTLAPFHSPTMSHAMSERERVLGPLRKTGSLSASQLPDKSI